MNASANFSYDDILIEAKKQAFMRAWLRPETLIVAGIAIVMASLCLLRIFWFPGTWWVWLLFGMVGSVALTLSTAHDDKYVQQVAVRLFYQRYDKQRLHLPELKQSVSQALDYHRLLFQEIAERPHAPLSNIAVDMDQLVANIYRVAYMLDSFVADERIRRYLNQLMESHTQEMAGNPAESVVKPVNSLDDFTLALMPIQYSGAANMPNAKAELLDNVCRVVALARTQLNDAITNISAVHRKVATTSTSSTLPGDWSFVDTIHTTFIDYSQNLEDNATALDRLYSSCTLAAMAVKA